jgi:DNA-directed RNA polymerase subunit RPC12/RpoP
MTYEDCITDEDCNRVFHASIRATNRRNPQRYDCPTCGAKRALSAHQKQQGYQCDGCADRAEGGML